MVEREGAPQKPEDMLSIHELGGLGKEKWRSLIPILPKDSKIADYAHAVDEGLIEDTGFNHRQYLGARHWDSLILPSGSILNSPEASDRKNTRLYAAFEKVASYSLDDHLNSLRSDGWSWLSRSWDTPVDKVVDEEEFYQGHAYPKKWHKEYRENLGWNAMRERLLTEEEVSDPTRTSPKKLGNMLHELIKTNPDLVHDRLVSLKFGYQWGNNIIGTSYSQPHKRINFPIEDLYEILLGTDDFGEVGRYIQQLCALHFGLKKPGIALYGERNIWRGQIVDTRRISIYPNNSELRNLRRRWDFGQF